MTPASRNAVWKLAWLLSALLLTGMILVSVHSLRRATRGALPSGSASPAAAEESSRPPADTPTTPSPPAGEETGPGDPAPSITAEFEGIRQREAAREELLRTLRRQAKDRPDDPGTLSEEQIDQLEKSGDSLM